jgi:hypothetical protein
LFLQTVDELVVKIAQGYEIFNQAKALLHGLHFNIYLLVYNVCDTSLSYEPQNEEVSILKYAIKLYFRPNGSLF